MAERLGIGLQNRVPRFESGRCLKRVTRNSSSFFIINLNLFTSSSAKLELESKELIKIHRTQAMNTKMY